jgi:hypothetical protein
MEGKTTPRIYGNFRFHGNLCSCGNCSNIAEYGWPAEIECCGKDIRVVEHAANISIL